MRGCASANPHGFKQHFPGLLFLGVKLVSELKDTDPLGPSFVTIDLIVIQRGFIRPRVLAVHTDINNYNKGVCWRCSPHVRTSPPA